MWLHFRQATSFSRGFLSTWSYRPRRVLWGEFGRQQIVQYVWRTSWIQNYSVPTIFYLPYGLQLSRKETGHYKNIALSYFDTISIPVMHELSCSDDTCILSSLECPHDVLCVNKRRNVCSWSTIVRQKHRENEKWFKKHSDPQLRIFWGYCLWADPEILLQIQKFTEAEGNPLRWKRKTSFFLSVAVRDEGVRKTKKIMVCFLGYNSEFVNKRRIYEI